MVEWWVVESGRARWSECGEWCNSEIGTMEVFHFPTSETSVPKRNAQVS